MKSLLLAIFRYRGFIVDSIKRDFQSRYQASFLGAAWLVLQPIAMISVYTLIFSELMKAKFSGVSGQYAYSIYLCSGVLTWGLFSETLNNLVNVFISNANVLKKINFPKICLPIIVSVSAFLNFLIIFTLFVIFLILTHNFPGWIILAIIPVLIIQMIFTVGLGVLLGVVNVFVRDVGQFVIILTQFWFWFTPIVYVRNILPDWSRGLIDLNPMAVFIEAYQKIILFQQQPDWYKLLPVAIIAIIIFMFSWSLFRKHAADIVDEI